MNDTKEVYFHEYCLRCKFSAVDETEDPCDDCLTQGFNIDSHKPIEFKEKEI